MWLCRSFLIIGSKNRHVHVLCFEKEPDNY